MKQAISEMLHLGVLPVLYLACEHHLEVFQGAAEWCSWRSEGAKEQVSDGVEVGKEELSEVVKEQEFDKY